MKWRGINNPNLWFHHPRAFWESSWYRLPLRRRWYLALHDPIYVSVWVALVILLSLTAWAVL